MREMAKEQRRKDNELSQSVTLWRTTTRYGGGGGCILRTAAGLGQIKVQLKKKEKKNNLFYFSRLVLLIYVYILLL